MMYKVWCSIEDVPYCFSRSFIKFQGHTGWLIYDFNSIWVRLLGQSQVSNPSDLSCDWYCWKKSQIAKKCDGKSMMTDNYLDMKEISKLLIFNYIIWNYLWSYGNHSKSTFIYLFINLFIYQSINLIHNISPVSLCSVKAWHLIKPPPVNLCPEAFFLTLHYHMHFINNGNEEIQAQILEFSADRMQQPLHVLILGMWQFYCHSYFALISSCNMVIR